MTGIGLAFLTSSIVIGMGFGGGQRDCCQDREHHDGAGYD
jgi:hypothetical protein